MSAVEVERAAVAASGRLAALHGRCFDRGWSEREIASLIHLPGGRAWIAKVDGVDAGLAIIRAIGGEAEVLTIAALPAARRQGVGRALLEALEAGAQEAEAARLFLEVSTGNPAAIALYEQAGFAGVGLRKAYYADGSDARVMEKRLCGDGQGASPAPI